jgi:hypothetical protein
MNHRPFEDWLLEEKPLGAQEKRDLELHLRSCTSCAAIAESNLELHATRMISPPDGFTDRFALRLEAYRRDQRWRQMVGTLILVLGGVGLSVWAAGPSLQDALSSPATWIAGVVGYFLFILTWFQVLSQLTLVLMRDLPSFVSPAEWTIMALLGGGAGLFWVLSLRRLARASQGV